MKGGIRGYNETKTDVGNALNLGLYWLFFCGFYLVPSSGALYTIYIYIIMYIGVMIYNSFFYLRINWVDYISTIDIESSQSMCR